MPDPHPRPPVAHALITGGAGFVGSHLAERLLGAGMCVTVVDDLSTGRDANLAAVEADPRLRIVRADAHDPDVLADCVPADGVVFHLAAPVGLHRVLERPDRIILDGVAGIDAVLDAAATAGARVVFTSSSEVYGKRDRMPLTESDDLALGPPARARWGYALMKASQEAIALARHRRGEVAVVVARLFNVVGPRQTGRYGMVVPRFIRRALAGEPLLVHGDGSQTRTFLHVLDAVDALVALADHPDAPGDVYNIGGDTEISIHELARQVVAATDSASAIRTLPYADAYPEGYEDVPRRRPDTSKLRALTGWRPRRALPLGATIAPRPLT